MSQFSGLSKISQGNPLSTQDFGRLFTKSRATDFAPAIALQIHEETKALVMCGF